MTPEELDAMPQGSVVQGPEEYGVPGDVILKTDEGWLYDNCCGRVMGSQELAQGYSSLKVLYQPGWLEEAQQDLIRTAGGLGDPDLGPYIAGVIDMAEVIKKHGAID